MSDTLVSVYERVIRREKEAQRGGFAHGPYVKILASEGLRRLSNRGIECAVIADAD